MQVAEFGQEWTSVTPVMSKTLIAARRSLKAVGHKFQPNGEPCDVDYRIALISASGR
jgi:hypothetical protein